MDATGPNAEQITYWNETGPKWVANQERVDAMIEPFGRAAMDALRLAPGEHVIDVGCGCGETTLELARRVGPTGAVLGVDISAPMLERARARAAGVSNARFTLADAQTNAFAPASADAVFSRFGVMFFVDPMAAFRNLRAALREGGRLAFACWQPLPANLWMAIPLAAAATHVALPPPPSPDAPGPFSFGDADRVRRILGGAGFVDVECTSFAPMVDLGGGLGVEAATEFVLSMGPTARVLREAQAPPEVFARVEAAVREAIAPYHTDRGVVMPSASWIVTARHGSR